jgi:hypothetical protein
MSYCTLDPSHRQGRGTPELRKITLEAGGDQDQETFAVTPLQSPSRDVQSFK